MKLFQDFYAARNIVMTFILENQTRRSSFVVDKVLSNSEKFGILPQRLISTFEKIFDQSRLMSDDFQLLSDFLFGKIGAKEVNARDWKRMTESLLVIPELIDDEIWISVTKMIVLALAELSVTSSQNINAILLFISSIFTQFALCAHDSR